MFDHINLRVADPSALSSAFTAVLDELENPADHQPASPSVWGKFALTQTDEEHQILRNALDVIRRTPVNALHTSTGGIDQND